MTYVSLDGSKLASSPIEDRSLKDDINEVISSIKQERNESKDNRVRLEAMLVNDLFEKIQMKLSNRKRLLKMIKEALLKDRSTICIRVTSFRPDTSVSTSIIHRDLGERLNEFLKDKALTIYDRRVRQHEHIDPCLLTFSMFLPIIGIPLIIYSFYKNRKLSVKLDLTINT